jgi:arsenate reductase
MAEAFLRQYGSDFFEAHSAGLEPEPIHPLTLQVMKEAGYDLLALGHHPKGLYTFLREKHAGYLITVCANAEAKCPILPGVSVREYWGFEDPAAFEGSKEARLAKFRETRDRIEDEVRSFIARETTTENPRLDRRPARS